MTRTLRHATALTDHREFERLDESLLLSVIELSGLGARRTACSALTARLWRTTGPMGSTDLVLAASSESFPDPTRSSGAPSPFTVADNVAREAPDGAVEALASQQAVQRTVAAQREARFMTWLPVQRQAKTLAVLEIDSTAPLSPGRLMLVQGMCSLYANHLSLLHESQVDTLTQLLNRKTFDDSIQRLLAAPQAGRQAWIAVVDIDHFKRINDGFGHLFGDEVLLLVAGILKQSFRVQDKVFRFGGEEFVILLQDAEEDGALTALDRCRGAIEARPFPQVGRVTVSIGATRIRPGDNACDVLGRADDALYHAKQHGRNQLQVFDHLKAHGDIAEQPALHGEVDLF